MEDDDLVCKSLIILVIKQLQMKRTRLMKTESTDQWYTTRAMCVKIEWKGCEKCVKKRNHVKSMLEKIQVHHISISHACEIFDMHVKFCNTCEKFLSYVWTFFPCILLHVKSFHTCETIFVMHMNFKFHIEIFLINCNNYDSKWHSGQFTISTY